MLKKNKKIIEEINLLLTQLSKVVDAERSTFFLLNSDKNKLESIVAQGLDNITISVPIGKGLVGRMFETQNAIIENSVQSNKYFATSYDKQLNFTTKSIICVPIFNQKKIIVGALQCLNSSKGGFVKSDLEVLSSFAAAVSLIIKNSELYFASEHLKNNFSTLLEVFSAVSSELDLNNLIQVIMNKAAEISKAERSSLFLLDEKTGELWTVFAKGLENTVVKTKKGIVAQVAKKKEAIIENVPYKNPFFDASIDKKTNFTTKSILSVPVFNSENKILGVIQVINKVEGVFNNEDLNILTGFASQIRIAIENAKLFDQIQNMKNYLNVLVQNLDSGIVTVDESFYIKTLNQKFLEIFNLKKDYLSNKSINSIQPSIRDLLLLSEKTIETGEKYYQNDIEIAVENDKKIAINQSVLPMHDVKGEIIGAINVFNDLSKEKRIQSNLSRYIPQHLVDEVMNRENVSMLKGNFSKCSILFSDIRNFTTLTEEFGAIQIVELLNKYFEVMVSSVYKHNGILDKFIGDAIMTVFGVPYANSSDAKNAVACALDMFNMLKLLNENNANLPQINIGVGISTGNVVSGNIGAENRFEYTVIGDSVNIAARLESATKTYGVNLLICENTYNEVKEHFCCLELDEILVKGKQNPIKIFTVLDGTVETEFIDCFSIGLTNFKNKNYIKAKKEFKKAKKILPEFKPVVLLLEKCIQA